MPLGIDVGGTKIAFGEVKNGNLLWKDQIPTPKNKETIIETLSDIIKNHEGNDIGIGIPGQVKNGKVLFTPNIPLSNTNLEDILAQKTGKHIAIENDANAFLIAEIRWGVARGHASAIGITLGTGIGGAIYINGNIWQGAHGAGAEFGHMSVIEDGPMCGCGTRGCVEAIASPRSIEKWIAEQMENGFPTNLTHCDMKTVMEKKDEDTLCRLAYDRFIRFITMATANLVNIIDPEVVVFGGSGVLSWDIWHEDAYKLYERKVLPSIKGKVKWLRAQFINNSGIIGAAAIVNPLA